MRRIKILVIATLMAMPIMAASAPPASACMGEICDAINWVCNRVPKHGGDCVG